MTRTRSCFAPKIEALENRTVPYAATGYKWAITNVSASFLPDGTSTEGYSSSLFAALDKVAPREAWQGEFARALQTWANVSNLNFRFVADDGSPTGTSGSAQGDSRFGDIRLGAHVLDGYLGYAYYPSSTTKGGDITLNPNYTFRIGTNIDLYSTLLHEAGHALGLGHSSSGTVMYSTITGVYSGLSADDIAGIQALYGARKHDSFDLAALNDSLSAASLLSLGSSGGLNVSADLTSLADVDYYKIVAPTSADGTLTVSVDARNLSLLTPKISVYDAAGSLVGTANAASYGGVATLSLNGLKAGQAYYVVADGATGDAFGMGAYKLNVQFGVTSSPTPTPTPPPPSGLAADRFETNNNFSAATSLGKKSSFNLTDLTIHSATDVDYFTFIAQSSGTYSVSSKFVHAAGNLDLFVYDGSGRLLASSASLTDNETVALGLSSGQRYYVKVVGVNGEDNDYSLSMTQLSSTSTSRGKGKGKGAIASGQGVEVGHGSYAAGFQPEGYDHEDEHEHGQDRWHFLEAIPADVLDFLPTGLKKKR